MREAKVSYPKQGKLVLAILLVFSCLPQFALCIQASPSVSLSVREARSDRELEYIVHSSISSASPVSPRKEVAPLLKLYHPSEEFGCESFRDSPNLPFALLVKRGKCNFRQKAEIAKSAGASALIVINTEDSLYNHSNGILYDPCTLDCQMGSSLHSASECESYSSCASGLCLSNPVTKVNANTDQMFCCVNDGLLLMQLADSNHKDPKEFDFPAVFVNIMDGMKLVSSTSLGETYVAVYERPVKGSWISMILLWMFASLLVSGASYRVTYNDRQAIRTAFSTNSPSTNREELDGLISGNEEEGSLIEKTDRDDDTEEVELDLSSVIGFFLISSVALVCLFFIVSKYPHTTIIIFILLFGFGSIHSMSIFFTRPFVRMILPRHISMGTYVLPKKVADCFGSDNRQVTVESVLGVSFAVFMVIAWFVFRHQDAWVWALQDILSISVTCAFLLNIRIPTLRLATYLLVSFFFYDIFMTFITPVFFGGKSVMMEVATAGRATQKAVELTCERTLSEKLPMLFLIPRFDYFGGFSMLGLGDVFLPGLFIVYCLRVDYLKMKIFQRENPDQTFNRSQFLLSHRYYIPVCIAYSMGFIAVLLANKYEITINGVQGQPALLYLVPFTLGTFHFLAYRNKDLATLWNISLASLDPEEFEEDTEEGDDHETV